MSFFPSSMTTQKKASTLWNGKVQFRIFRNKGEATWTHRWKLC